MDLDGIWSDTLDYGSVRPGNGKYDTRQGDLDLKIWSCRLKADNLIKLGSETDILTNYFDKNHRYRKGELISEQKALVYNDDDWKDLATTDEVCMAIVYGVPEVTAISDPEITTADDYIINHLTTDYELMFIRSHGSPRRHGFDRHNQSIFEYVYCRDYCNYSPSALFYSLFVCSGADYTSEDYLAGILAFNINDSGLLAWGSTKSGGMLYDASFYLAMAKGEVCGEAFKQWFNQVQTNCPADSPQWWYGMVLIGDATLKPKMKNINIYR